MRGEIHIKDDDDLTQDDIDNHHLSSLAIPARTR